MKKSMKIFAIAMTIGFCGLLTSSATSTNAVPINETETVCNEDDGIGCKVYDEGAVVSSCFICNCSKLVETYWENKK